MKVLNEEEISITDSCHVCNSVKEQGNELCHECNLNAYESAKEFYLEHEARRQRFKSNKICWDVDVPEGWKDIKVAKFD